MDDFLRRLLLLDVISNLLSGLLVAFGRVFVFLLVIALALLLTGRRAELNAWLNQLRALLITRAATVGPPDFQEVMPSGWAIIQTEPINIDGGPAGENDWLVLYRYEPLDRGPRGAIGGVIYDLQPDLYPPNPATPRPFRPSSFIPYPLLPRPGGLGYLGESHVTLQVYDADGDPSKQELVVLGYSGYGDIITHLSIFQWRSDTEGYRIMSSPDGSVLYGDAGIEIIAPEISTPVPGPTPTPLPLPKLGPPPIQRVIVRRHLWEPFYYARSRFAQRIDYVWEGPPETRTLRPLSPTLDFAYTRPVGLAPGLFKYAVWYPEEALLAHYQPGRVRNIILPAGSGLDTTVDIVAQVLDQSGQLWQIPWRATQLTNPDVKQMNVWALQQLGGPTLP